MNKIKVLWFSLSPCGSVRRFEKERVFQGWMISLEDEIKKNPDVELSVAYISSSEWNSFIFDGVTYFPMFQNIGRTRLKRVINRYKAFESGDKWLISQMVKVVEKAKPDVIHIHGTEQGFGLIQNYVKDVPILFSIQGLIAPVREKYFSGISKQLAFKSDSLSELIRKRSIKQDYTSFIYRGIREREMLRNARYIAGRTFWDYYITLGINPKRKFFKVNEILRPQFYIKHWEKDKFDKRLKIVSTVSGGLYKGLETVLKASSLLKEYADFDFEWNIAGIKENDNYAILCVNATEIDYQENNIHLLGRLNAEELSDLLLASDVYVQVSHIENSPNSLCEAMLVGLPCIASFAGGTSTLLKDHQEGILYQDGDPYVLEGAIVEMYHNFQDAKSYGSAARQTAITRHNKADIVKSLLNTYNTIIEDYQK